AAVRDRVGAAALAGVAAKRAGDGVAVAKPARRHLVGEGGVVAAVGLALRIGGDRDRPLLDRQLGADVAEVVVGGERDRALRDRVGADVLARVAAKRAREGIAGHE